jgi:arginyl-tRNA synthetase
VERAEADLRRRLEEEGRHEEEAFIRHAATTMGLAAVKYTDLSQNRITNYQFGFERMLALQGNTAPYLLYAVVRIAGIARKGGALEGDPGSGADSGGHFPDPLIFREPQEWALVRELLKFDAVIADVEEELLPNRLCGYLFELSQVFNRFYDQVPVLRAEEPTRGSRLALCRLTADTLKLGLGLLGIPTLERM